MRIVGWMMVACVGLSLGCQRAMVERPLGSGRLLIEFDSVSEGERDAVRERMERAGAETLGDGLRFLVTIEGGRSLEIEELCAAIDDWHRQVMNIRNDLGVEIVASERVDVGMRYASSMAQTVGGAAVIITPLPTEAKLFIDTRMPGLDEFLNDDGSVRLNEGDRFRAELPFSFVRETDRIYFHTAYRGSQRYFYYDILLEKQVEVAGIRSDADWEYFQRTGLRPRD